MRGPELSKCHHVPCKALKVKAKIAQSLNGAVRDLDVKKMEYCPASPKMMLLHIHLGVRYGLGREITIGNLLPAHASPEWEGTGGRR